MQFPARAIRTVLAAANGQRNIPASHEANSNPFNCESKAQHESNAETPGRKELDGLRDVAQKVEHMAQSARRFESGRSALAYIVTMVSCASARRENKEKQVPGSIPGVRLTPSVVDRAESIPQTKRLIKRLGG